MANVKITKIEIKRYVKMGDNHRITSNMLEHVWLQLRQDLLGNYKIVRTITIIKY